MTQDECSRLLTLIAARYSTSKLWEQDAALTVKVWHMSLEDVPYVAAERVLSEWFKTEKWAPDPSEIREGVNALIARCSTDEEREELEPGWLAWKQSLRAGQVVKRLAS